MASRKKRSSLLESKQEHQARIDKEAAVALPAIEKHLRAAHNHMVDIDHLVSRIWGHGSREQKTVRDIIDKISRM